MPIARTPPGPLPRDRIWAARSHVGRVRANNEDRYLIEADIGLFLVSDGMGGHQGGELASRIVIEDLPFLIENRLHRRRSDGMKTIRRILRHAIAELSRHMHLEGLSESGYKEMGATLVLALLHGRRAYAANLGDSRLYRWRNGRLCQLTRDHSVVGRLLRRGEITPQEAPYHEAQGQITRYVGMEEKARPFVRSFELQPRDRLLLCTDGLTDMLTDRQIARILRQTPKTQACCDRLIESANQAGGHDNVTVVLIDWQPAKSA